MELPPPVAKFAIVISLVSVGNSYGYAEGIALPLRASDPNGASYMTYARGAFGQFCCDRHMIQHFAGKRVGLGFILSHGGHQ